MSSIGAPLFHPFPPQSGNWPLACLPAAAAIKAG